MSTHRREPASRIGPIIWGTVAFVLVAAIGVSFLLSRQALSDAKRSAEGRVEEYATSVLRPALTPELTSSDLSGAAYRALFARVQEGILSDEGVFRVRIWKPNKDLIFSTDQRDAIADVVAEDDVRIEQAAADQTVSTVTESRVLGKDGLAGTEERLLETFAPLHLENELSTSGVVQIDHRYSAIEEEVIRFWRPTQIGLAIALGVSAMLFGITVRGRRQEPAPEARRTRTEPAPEGQAARVRDAEERTAAADRAAREAERKLADVERRLAVAEKRHGDAEDVGTAVSASVAKRVEELELQLRAEATEREQFQNEAQQLRSALSRKEAEVDQAGKEVQRLLATLSTKETELSVAREGMQGVEVETARSKDLVTLAEQRAAEAEQRAAEAEAEASDTRQRVEELERRLVEAEKRVSEAERRAVDAEGTAVELEARARAAEEAASKAASVGADASSAEAVAELEASVRAATTELDEARQQLQAKDDELAAMGQEVARLRAEASASPAAVPEAGDLQGLLRELEEQRRADVAELQRAHEMLANTQVELAEANRRLQQAEARALAGEVTPEEVVEARPTRRARPEPVLEEEPSEEPEPSEEEVEEEAAAADEEGLSLRERLTRAAAARHRTLGQQDGT